MQTKKIIDTSKKVPIRKYM